jgi:hypothetical protein
MLLTLICCSELTIVFIKLTNIEHDNRKRRRKVSKHAWSDTMNDPDDITERITITATITTRTTKTTATIM